MRTILYRTHLTGVAEAGSDAKQPGKPGPMLLIYY